MAYFVAPSHASLVQETVLLYLDLSEEDPFHNMLREYSVWKSYDAIAVQNQKVYHGYTLYKKDLEMIEASLMKNGLIKEESKLLVHPENNTVEAF